jgi:hypothetical protein
MNRRLIHKTKGAARNAVKEVIELAFAAELLDPSDVLWLVSPWLSNVPVIDNTAGGFSPLCPEAPKTVITLGPILAQLAARGTYLVIASRPGDGTPTIVQALKAVLGEDAEACLRYVEREELHTKGIVSNRFAIKGSMNITNNGLLHLDELITYTCDPAELQELRVTFEHEYGGRR